MLIQPFVENAIRHGLANKENDRTLFISIKDYDKEYVTCIIKDNGIGRVASAKIKANSGIKRESLGMQITEERIELVKQVYQKVIKIVIIDHVNDKNESLGTEVTISIPYITI
jgi:sensor histidine kinase YesM